MRVFVASNGDVVLLFDKHCGVLDSDEIEEYIRKAKDILSSNNAEFAIARNSWVGVLHIRYDDLDGNWICDDVWIRKKYDGFCDGIYLNRMSKESGFAKMARKLNRR